MNRVLRNSTSARPQWLITASFLFVAMACSNAPAPEPQDIACQGKGCACIFAQDCPEGMQCVNGACTVDDPFAFEGSDTFVADGSDSQGRTPDDLVTTEDQHQVVDQPFGAGCTDNGQCLSGWCLDSPDGGYCTQVCAEGCPAGWTCKTIAQTSPDYIEVCVLDKARLCLPCETDLHCGDAGDLCLDIGGGRFCGRDCTQNPCPEGYSCQDLALDGSQYKQCLPLNNACDCSAENSGQVRGCEVTNDLGTCYGEETCAGESGWVSCTAHAPTQELCDGLDNDCNGLTDEGMSPEPCSNDNEFGSCSGTRSCQGAAGWVCSAQVPAAETCNGLDDNCDGAIDETFQDAAGNYLTPEHCGTCGNACASKFEGALEVDCQMVGDQETCVIVECAPGYVLYGSTSCLDENAFLCQPCLEDADCFGDDSACIPVSDTDPRTFCTRSCGPESPFSQTCPPGYDCQVVAGESLCKPTNQSCDCTPANAGQTKACSVSNQAGLCFGFEVCDPLLGWQGCSAPMPAAEVCNGLDDDCDGMKDEETASGAPCTNDNESGSCPGEEVCLGVAGLACSAQMPTAEVCDGLDNNCDGQIDEGFALQVGDPPQPKYGLLVDHCGACNYACPAIAHGTASCDPEEEVPLCVVGDCDPGYFDFNGVACLPVPQANLCAPCVEDVDCQGPDDRCIPETEALGFCGRDCQAGSIYSTPELPCTGQAGEQGCCPDGFVCSANGAERQCLPLSGTCSCVDDGLVDACQSQNIYGTCLGTRTCIVDGGDAGWSDCSAPVPGPETCDLKDNDCDGLLDGLDDSLDYSTSPSGSASCLNGSSCQGAWLCLGGQWSCDAQALSPETCDGQDNDCDGVIDDGFISDGLYVHVEHCGACGYDCAQLIPNSGTQSCLNINGSPTCKATQCAPGHFLYGGGAACMALPDNLCQPCASDGDCLVPSSRCISAGIESFCGRDCSDDSIFGSECPPGYQCKAWGGSYQCVPPSMSCVCGPDTAGLVRSCTVGECSGKQTCVAGQAAYSFTECSTEGVVPEVCDGLDNDCDDEVDEGYLLDGKYATDEHCGVCGNNCTVQVSQVIHHATAGCAPQLDPPACVVSQCTTEVEGGNTYEWVDVNGILDDGCECRRIQGNLALDNPDIYFPADDPHYPTADAQTNDANCDGIDGVIGDALFVSAANPLPGEGSMDSPYQTLTEAIAAFPASGKLYILVAGGVYEENIVLQSGMKLHGGYSTDFRTRNIVLFTTEIRGVAPQPGELPGTVSANGISVQQTVLSGFTVVGHDGANGGPGEAGANSVAVYCLDCSESVEIRNNWLIGGTGGAGGHGGPGSNGYGAQSSGGNALAGSNGVNASNCLNGNCNNASLAGGAGGANSQCATGNGHQGGGVTCPVYNTAAYVPPEPGHDGTAGWTWTLDSGSSSGCGGHATEAGYPAAIKKLDGGDGHDGDDGADGSQGTGCSSALGSYVNGSWQGATASSGVTGTTGQGGGAGGPSGGVDSAPANQMPPGVGAYGGNSYKLGATGGGGGAAGCGGKGGQGGKSGGASIAVMVGYTSPDAALSPPIVVANLVQRGFGGTGGAGGYGGQGGLGGDGGTGGHSQNYWIDFKAGKGGRGGRGGEGGGGGGGCGGPSLGLAVFGAPGNWQVTYDQDNGFAQLESLKTGGTGGVAGASGLVTPNGKGSKGATKNLYISP